jgi:hypothetical protein
MSTLVTILRPIVQLGMNSWLDFGLWRFRRGIGDGLRPIAPSHGENRGSSPLGSANKIKDLLQDRRLVSNSCPINVYGQAWTVDDRKLSSCALCRPHELNGPARRRARLLRLPQGGGKV